jgi:hypothetical protein
MVDTARRRVLVLSDNEGLSRAIEVNLTSRLELDIVRFGSLERRRIQAEIGEFDLIVLAVSSPYSEPIVALAKSSLTDRIGRVPLLIISDRPFESDPDERIVHLDFPFKIDGLHDKVERILLGGTA